jgi:menaquinone-dependent protoporphyrinogen oxidase
MRRTGVFYATREGQTKRIAEHVAARLRNCGFETDVRNLSDKDDVNLNSYDAVVLAASVHAGRHEPEMRTFVKRHFAELNSLPNAFLSVTLSQAGAERTTATADERVRFAADVQKVIDLFVRETGWHPQRVKPVAGALLYTKYNFLLRFIMNRIAKKAGAETDTSRDYEYTNWAELDRFTDELSQEISETKPFQAAS